MTNYAVEIKNVYKRFPLPTGGELEACKDIKELTRDVVVKLISEVRVSENKEVEIVFDFDDCYKQLLESVEKLGYQVDKEPGGQLNISRREAV